MKQKQNCSSEQTIDTAVLFVIFNRLSTTTRVFEAIRKSKTPRLYIAADGPRDNRPEEAEKVQAVRDFVLKGIDWPCEVKTLLREKNLGCKKAVSSAISWFFEHEEMGIILEDDCLPEHSFFKFCDELLVRYKDDTRVWHIGGSNLQDGITRGDGSYYFSQYCLIWGWATWRRAWMNYDVEMKKFPMFKDQNLIENIWFDKENKSYWMKFFESVYNGKIDTWDYQWVFNMWSQSGLAISPNVNLILNIGFGEDATHTTEHTANGKMQTAAIGQIIHPTFPVVCREADRHIFNRYYHTSLLSRIMNKVSRIVK